VTATASSLRLVPPSTGTYHSQPNPPGHAERPPSQSLHNANIAPQVDAPAPPLDGTRRRRGLCDQTAHGAPSTSGTHRVGRTRRPRCAFANEMPFRREDAAVLTDVRCCRSGAVGHRQVGGVGCLAPAVGWERQGPSLGVVSTRPATAEDASFLQQMLAVSADWRLSARTDFVIDPATRRIVGFRLATWDRPVDHRSPRRAHRAARAQSRRQGARGTRAHRLPIGSYATSSTPTPDRSEASDGRSLDAC
jgi:hypothetical protein